MRRINHHLNNYYQYCNDVASILKTKNVQRSGHCPIIVFLYCCNFLQLKLYLCLTLKMYVMKQMKNIRIHLTDHLYTLLRAVLASASSARASMSRSPYRLPLLITNLDILHQRGLHKATYTSIVFVDYMEFSPLINTDHDLSISIARSNYSCFSGNILYEIFAGPNNLNEVYMSQGRSHEI